MIDTPWLDEPVFVTGTHGDIPWVMARQDIHSHWCGYVAIPPNHPWVGQEYDIDADVHGGITWNGRHPDNGHEWPDLPGATWVGFDCAHAGDLVPRRAEIGYGWKDDVWRDREYVRQECHRLAGQVIAATPVTRIVKVRQ